MPKKADIKTKETKASVAKFIDTEKNDERRADLKKIAKLMSKVTGAKGKMWGESIVGFGDYTYVSPRTGRWGDWFYMGFSPRKAAITIYPGCDVSILGETTLKKFGKYKASKGCLYIKKLSDIDISILEKLLTNAKKELTKIQKK